MKILTHDILCTLYCTKHQDKIKVRYTGKWAVPNREDIKGTVPRYIFSLKMGLLVVQIFKMTAAYKYKLLKKQGKLNFQMIFVDIQATVALSP